MPIQDCNGCDECNTTLEYHKDLHKETIPHDWITKYNTDTGKEYKMCSRCGKIDEESYEKTKVK